MAEIIWTAEAKTWLKDIYDYIAVDNPDAAARTVVDIFVKAQLLKNHPQIGQKYEFLDQREIRILLYGHYRIAYLVNQTTISIFWESSMGHSISSVTWSRLGCA